MKCHKIAIAAKIIEHLAKALGLSHGWLRFLYPQSPWEHKHSQTFSRTFCFLRPTVSRSQPTLTSTTWTTSTSPHRAIHTYDIRDTDIHTFNRA